jgi:iron complex outermembrane receptor protein
VLRGLDDFRVRVQEKGVGSMDVSDYCQDHGVPLESKNAVHDELVGMIGVDADPEALPEGNQAP